MFKKGDEIRQVKVIDGFDMVGGVFNVTGVSGDGLVSFSSLLGFGRGVMSGDAAAEYFELVKPKRVWSEWRPKYFKFLLSFSADCQGVVKYEAFGQFRENGKRVEACVGGFRASASCHDIDVFDLTRGLQLCEARIAAKLLLDLGCHV